MFTVQTGTHCGEDRGSGVVYSMLVSMSVSVSEGVCVPLCASVLVLNKKAAKLETVCE